MGGSGSGNWYRSYSKDTVDGLKSLDISRLNRHGQLRPGGWFTVSWTRRGEPCGSISFRSETNRIVLNYKHQSPYRSDDWESIEEYVNLTWTPCNFGGHRPWFTCPGIIGGRVCGRRVGKLYVAGQYFLCRHCYNLAYESQRESRCYRYLHRAQDIKRRLGGDPSSLAPFPAKPKGMHWKTYLRLVQEHDRYDTLSWAAAAEWMGMLEEAANLREAADLQDT